MTRIFVTASDQAMAQSVINALQPLWSDAQWQSDDAQNADLILQIGDTKQSEITLPVLHLDGQGAPLRLAHVVQRLKEMAAQARHLELGDYQLDLVQRVWHDPAGRVSDLTEKEVSLLHYLATIHPQAASREDLLRDVWKYADGADTHTVETHLYRLRQKIEQNPGDPTIVVSTKQGYILGVL